MKIKKLFSILGPGLLYAGAAVGVSHLVQSTRAGADYGFDLALVLIVANILKYPFFEFAPRYANTTGESLVDGYRKIGKWAVVLFALVTVLTMTAIAAAVLVVTAGLTGFVLNLHVNILYIDAGLLITAAVILLVGKYKALDTIIKYIIVLLAVSTFVAVFSAMGATEKAYHFLQNFDIASRPDILFLIAFVGWMPAPIDVSVWHSLWSKEKRKTQPKSENPSYVREGLLDFRIGYIGTAIVALAFLTLGAFVMFDSGETLSANGLVFSKQLIQMYTTSIGQWAYAIIAIAAVATMFSTTLTVIDAYPRVLTPLTRHLIPNKKFDENKLYWIWLVVVLVSTLLFVGFMANSMRFIVDLATTMSFVTAPILAFLNHKAVTMPSFPELFRPSKGLLIYSWVGIVFLSVFSILYIYYILI